MNAKQKFVLNHRLRLEDQNVNLLVWFQELMMFFEKENMHEQQSLNILISEYRMEVQMYRYSNDHITLIYKKHARRILNNIADNSSELKKEKIVFKNKFRIAVSLLFLIVFVVVIYVYHTQYNLFLSNL